MIAGISIIMGIVVAIVCPDSPPKSTCFSEQDKILMVERVRSNDQGNDKKSEMESSTIQGRVHRYLYLFPFQPYFPQLGPVHYKTVYLSI